MDIKAHAAQCTRIHLRLTIGDDVLGIDPTEIPNQFSGFLFGHWLAMCYERPSPYLFSSWSGQKSTEESVSVLSREQISSQVFCRNESQILCTSSEQSAPVANISAVITLTHSILICRTSKKAENRPMERERFLHSSFLSR